jgi:hypothetical protein
MSIAKTILEQIKMIDPMATWAWGAKDMVAHGRWFAIQNYWYGQE